VHNNKNYIRYINVYSRFHDIVARVEKVVRISLEWDFESDVAGDHLGSTVQLRTQCIEAGSSYFNIVLNAPEQCCTWHQE